MGAHNLDWMRLEDLYAPVPDGLYWGKIDSEEFEEVGPYLKADGEWCAGFVPTHLATWLRNPVRLPELSVDEDEDISNIDNLD